MVSRPYGEARFTPEYREAFEDWLALDPLDDPNRASAGLGYMPSDEDPLEDKLEQFLRQSSEAFEAWNPSKETGEKYVRVTVVLGTVLSCLGQRFYVREAFDEVLHRRVGSPARLRSRHHGDASPHRHLRRTRPVLTCRLAGQTPPAAGR